MYIYMYIYTLYMLEMCRFRMKDEETWCSKKKKHFKTEKYMTSLCFQSVGRIFVDFDRNEDLTKWY